MAGQIFKVVATCLLVLAHSKFGVQAGATDLYTQGKEGEDKCPPGYNPITTPSLCEAAAQQLRYRWSPTKGWKNQNSVCNYCGGCRPKEVRLSSDHGKKAYWICTKDPSTTPAPETSSTAPTSNTDSPKFVCCGLVQQYPDLVPGVRWGSMKNNEDDKNQWNEKNCGDVVGGQSKSNCGSCINIYNGATDSWGHICEVYTDYNTDCGRFDNEDFDSHKLCCVCGGGDRMYDPSLTAAAGTSSTAPTSNTGTRYSIGGPDTLCSDRSTETITTIDECKAAVDELKDRGSNVDYKEHEENAAWPRGCYLHLAHTGTDVYYNIANTGMANSHASPICKFVE